MGLLDRVRQLPLVRLGQEEGQGAGDEGAQTECDLVKQVKFQESSAESKTVLGIVGKKYFPLTKRSNFLLKAAEIQTRGARGS